MTLRTVKPLLAAWSPYRNLSIEDVFAGMEVMNVALRWSEIRYATDHIAMKKQE